MLPTPKRFDIVKLPQLFPRVFRSPSRLVAAVGGVERGAPDFEVRIALWEQVITTRGRQIVADGMLSEAERARTGADFAAWAQERAQRQTLVLAAVEGTVAA